MNKEKYYLISGKYTVASVLLVLLVGILGSILLGFVYGYLVHYIPFIYLNFLIAFGYGAAIGMLVNQGAKKGKIRNNLVCKIISVIAGLSAIYISWVAWIYAMSEQEMLLLNPVDIWQYSQLISMIGIWDLKGWIPQGWQLYLIWSVEAILIVGSAIFMTGVSEPFCENCQCWSDKMDDIVIASSITNKQKLISELEKGNIDVVKEVLQKNEEGLYTKIEAYSCPQCHAQYYITINSGALKVNKKGETETTEAEILKNLIVTEKDYKMLQALS